MMKIQLNPYFLSFKKTISLLNVHSRCDCISRRQVRFFLSAFQLWYGELDCNRVPPAVGKKDDAQTAQAKDCSIRQEDRFPGNVTKCPRPRTWHYASNFQEASKIVLSAFARQPARGPC